MRVGSGHDTHRLIDGRPLVLGGIAVPHSQGLLGHSDADVVLHAITDALLGAAGLGDIGDLFPDSDPNYKDADSSRFVAEAMRQLNLSGWRPVNVDVTIFAEAPKLGTVKTRIRDNVASLLQLPADAVNVKAKTGESVGHIGRGEAIGCHAVVLIERSNLVTEGRAHDPSPQPPPQNGEGEKDKMAALQVYSTLTRKKEPFPKKAGETVTMYVCGPTVYKPSHIGHMVGPVIFDAIKRYLAYLGYSVKWIVNITDVDDKLIKRAGELKTTVKELAERMTADYHECLKRLNVTGIDAFPKATEHIPDMIETIAGLIAKGYAYPADGDVYFNVARDEDYGKLCGFDPEELEAGSRIEASTKKKNPGDFALWKSAKPGEPSWDSLWGAGRPGWHIECTAMAIKLLGETLDIHGGGLDLRFPHHENELAQSESVTGKPFARVWMHNGLLKMGSGKMAGSVGNVLNVEEALKHVSGEALRFFILNTHYRSPIDLGEWDPRDAQSPRIPPGLENAKKAHESFVRLAERFDRVTGKKFHEAAVPTKVQADRNFSRPEFGEYLTRFREHMDDDFNTGGAVGVLFELINSLNRLADSAKLEDPAKAEAAGRLAFEEGALLAKELGQILGLFFEAPKVAALSGDDKLVSGLMQLVIELRNNLRAEAKKIAGKDDPTKKMLFGQTDIIRQRLAELGITLEDRPAGTTWRMG
jgi:cysteinyl-tRNA synthetase